MPRGPARSGSQQTDSSTFHRGRAGRLAGGGAGSEQAAFVQPLSGQRALPLSPRTTGMRAALSGVFAPREWDGAGVRVTPPQPPADPAGPCPGLPRLPPGKSALRGAGSAQGGFLGRGRGVRTADPARATPGQRPRLGGSGCPGSEPRRDALQAPSPLRQEGRVGNAETRPRCVPPLRLIWESGRRWGRWRGPQSCP